MKLYKLKSEQKESIRKVLTAIILSEDLAPYPKRDVELIDTCVQLLLELDDITKQVNKAARKSKRKVMKEIGNIVKIKPK